MIRIRNEIRHLEELRRHERNEAYDNSDFDLYRDLWFNSKYIPLIDALYQELESYRTPFRS